MTKGILKYIFPLLLAAVSCTRSAAPAREPVALVRDIVSRASPEGDIIAGAATPRPEGEIYIAGSPVTSTRLLDSFLACDIFENARGNAWSDGLKDFAGEVFCSISDWARSPYDILLDSSPAGSDSLRELAVRYALAALDTKYNMSVYDLSGNGTKQPAKMIVFADPWLLEYGKFDVDTLFALTSCSVPVLSAQDLLFDSVLAGERKCFNIGLICDSTYLGKGIYPAIFKSKCARHDVVGVKFFEGSADGSAGSLYRFLDSYAAAGNSAPLDALLIDNPDMDMALIEKELKAARDFSREEFLHYGNLVSPDLMLENSGTLVMRKCYTLLRQGNLFTHRIAQPAFKPFIASPRPWAEDMQFLLIAEEDNV